MISKLAFVIRTFREHGLKYTAKVIIKYLGGNIVRGFRLSMLYLEYIRFLSGDFSRLGMRLYVIKRFRAIHRAVHCLHTEADLLCIADSILKVPDSIDGDIIECGTYTGGSTAKLSIIAKLTGRQLIACDSFQGLPDKVIVGKDGQRYEWGGVFAGTLCEVVGNVVNYGEIEPTSFLPGWFEETLPRLKAKIYIAIFEDADIYDSIKCCIDNLWHRLQPGCRMFTHEAYNDPALKAYEDSGLPPIKYVGRGKRRATPHLGYVVKGK
jgi:hypothetical protein